jgi:hypothetical protein
MNDNLPELQGIEYDPKLLKDITNTIAKIQEQALNLGNTNLPDSEKFLILAQLYRNIFLLQLHCTCHKKALEEYGDKVIVLKDMYSKLRNDYIRELERNER